MEALLVLFKSGLTWEESVKVAEKREALYRKVKGLKQKYYIRDPASGQVGGVYILDSKESLEELQRSVLKDTGEVYKAPEPPTQRVFDVLKLLYEQKD